MLDRHNRIYEKKDYNSLYRTGRRIAGKYIIVFIRDNSLERNRFGFVCSKKVGKAVVRNRAKRQLRAIVRNHMPDLKSGYDVVIVAKFNISKASFYDIEEDFLHLMKRVQIL